MAIKDFAKSFLFLIPLTLAGCQSPTTPMATEPDLVGTRIAVAAEKASKALDIIAQVEKQRTPVATVQDYSSAPPSLTQPITIQWVGPIEQITQTLATRSGMRFSVKGQTPPVPLTVTVDVFQKPIVEVLRDIGLQAGQRADLAVDGQFGVIEIRYASVDKL